MDLANWFYTLGIVYISLSLGWVLVLFGLLFAVVWKVRKMKLAAEEMVVTKIATRLMRDQRFGYSLILLPIVKSILVKVKEKLEKDI